MSERLSDELELWAHGGHAIPSHETISSWAEDIAALESSLAQAQADMEALRATIRSIERADETGDWSDYWDAVHRALAALPEHLRGESR